MKASNNSMNLLMALSSLQSHLQKRLDLLFSYHGISFSEFMVMHHLSEAPQQAMRRIDLADKVGLSASGITRLIAPMQKIKLVKKEANARDARVSLVKLTSAGQELLSDATASFQQSSRDIVIGLNDKEITSMLGLLGKVSK